MNAESFIKEKEITWDKPFNNWNRTAFKKALNEFADKHHNEPLLINSVLVPKGTLSCGCKDHLTITFTSEGDYCGNCGKIISKT